MRTRVLDRRPAWLLRTWLLAAYSLCAAGLTQDGTFIFCDPADYRPPPGGRDQVFEIFCTALVRNGTGPDADLRATKGFRPKRSPAESVLVPSGAASAPERACRRTLAFA
jgi:hypothetical protein